MYASVAARQPSVCLYVIVSRALRRSGVFGKNFNRKVVGRLGENVDCGDKSKKHRYCFTHFISKSHHKVISM